MFITKFQIIFPIHIVYLSINNISISQFYKKNKNIKNEAESRFDLIMNSSLVEISKRMIWKSVGLELK